MDTPLGKISFNAKGDAAGMGLSIYQVKDGKFTICRFDQDDGHYQLLNGTLESAGLVPVDADARPELVVRIRSAGSGSYLSAHAFTIDRSGLHQLVSVAGLPPDADAAAALRSRLTGQPAGRP